MKPLNKLLFICLLCYSPWVFAQTADRILSVVDEDIILLSEVDEQYQYYIKSGQKDDGTLRCAIFENLLMNKVLLSKARHDSLVITESEIEQELNRRIGNIVRQLGSVEQLETIYKKSIIELKLELRPEIENQLLIDEQRRKVIGGIKLTPREVKAFFATIPKDSIPYLPAEVEICHIVLRPKSNEFNKQLSKDELTNLVRKIKKGEITFEQAAKDFSDDIGSAKEGGKLGEFGRGEMVGEFEEVAFNMGEGQISEVFESPYGFHVIRLNKRYPDRVDASHILLRPKIDKSDELQVQDKLKDIRKLIVNDSLTFAEAARKYSDDVRTKDNGGTILSNSGENRIPLDQLDADLYLKIDQMKPGDISEPLSFISQEGELTKAYHIVQLRKRIAPHKASLQEDYQKFYNAGYQARQAEELQKWFKQSKKQVYIEIKDNDCSQALENWE